jgi:hypothetical protein
MARCYHKLTTARKISSDNAAFTQKRQGLENITVEGIAAADRGLRCQFWIGRVIGNSAKAHQIQHDYAADDIAVDKVFSGSLRWFEMANKFTRGHSASFQLYLLLLKSVGLSEGQSNDMSSDVCRPLKNLLLQLGAVIGE